MEHISFKCNYKYGQLFKKSSRHRSKCVTECSVLGTFSIRQPNAKEFPLAFRVTKYLTRQPGMTSYDDYDSEQAKFGLYDEDIRCIDKQLYRPVRYEHGACEGDFISSLTHISEYIGNLRISDFPYDDGQTHHDVQAEPVIKVMQYSGKILCESNQKAIIKDIRHAVNDLVFFDGHLWKKCEEPRYTYTTFGLCGDGTGFFVEYGISHNKKFYFSANERTLAKSTASAVAKDRLDLADAMDIQHTKQNIKVYRKDLVTEIKGRKLG